MFDAILERAKLALSLVRKVEEKVREEKSTLFEIVREYNNKRTELFNEKFRASGINWCTKCHKLFPPGQLMLLLVKSTQEERCGYEGGEYTLASREWLHRACADCQKEIYKRNGWRGEFDRWFKDRPSYDVYEVELREDGYYQKMENRKVDQVVKLPGMPPELFRQFCAEWEIPPELGFDREGELASKGSVKDVFVP